MRLYQFACLPIKNNYCYIFILYDIDDKPISSYSENWHIGVRHYRRINKAP